MSSYQIMEASRRSGLSSATIRFYESEDVLPAPDRKPSGYRSYDDDDIELLRFVSTLRSLELPLSRVREIVELRTDGKPPCRVVRRAIAEESKAIETRIDELRELQAELARLEAVADGMDDWPSDCVCTAIVGQTS